MIKSYLVVRSLERLQFISENDDRLPAQTIIILGLRNYKIVRFSASVGLLTPQAQMVATPFKNGSVWAQMGAIPLVNSLRPFKIKFMWGLLIYWGLFPQKLFPTGLFLRSLFIPTPILCNKWKVPSFPFIIFCYSKTELGVCANLDFRYVKIDENNENSLAIRKYGDRILNQMDFSPCRNQPLVCFYHMKYLGKNLTVM